MKIPFIPYHVVLMSKDEAKAWTNVYDVASYYHKRTMLIRSMLAKAIKANTGNSDMRYFESIQEKMIETSETAEMMVNGDKSVSR